MNLPNAVKKAIPKVLGGGHSIAEEQPIKLGEYLVKEGILSEKVINSALAEQSITEEVLGAILVRNGFLTQEQLINAILNLAPEKLVTEQSFTARVPGSLLNEFGIILNAETDDHLYLSSLSPETIAREHIEHHYPDKKLVFMPLLAERLEAYLSRVGEMGGEDDKMMVDSMIRVALTRHISDIHILPRHSSYTILFRYMGVRQHYHEGELEEYNKLTARIKDRARMDLAERRVPQDGAFQVEHNGRFIDMRVATLPMANGEGIIIRLLDPDRVQPSLDKLGISRVKTWRDGVSRPDGLCLICGPTGSGKTTTLNATVKEMDRFGKAIYTIEDPVEYRISYTGQVSINQPVGLDFARGIRAFMRADPDVIILGEIRDEETARNAVKAAETGHLVLGTLHTGSISGALERLRDIGVESHELRYLLRSIMVQRLIRVTCPTCHGAGCEACMQSGYSGRTVVSECEYFADEDAVDKLLDGVKTWPTMAEDAILKLKHGETDEREIIRVFGTEGEKLIEGLKED